LGYKQQETMRWNISDTTKGGCLRPIDGAVSLTIETRRNGLITWTFPPLPQPAATGGITLDLKQGMKTFQYYVASLYAYSYEGNYGKLRLGISDHKYSGGAQIAEIQPAPGPWPSRDFPFQSKVFWRRHVIPFVAPADAAYLSLLGDADTTKSVGCFVDAVTLYPAKTTSTHRKLCRGDSMQLTSGSSPGVMGWQEPSSAYLQDGAASVYAKDSGWYVCYTVITDTVLVDSVHIEFADTGFTTGNHHLSVCSDSAVILAIRDFQPAKFLWSTGDTSACIKATHSGVYWLNTNYGSHCSAADTFYVHLVKPAPIHLPADTVLCDGQMITIDATTPPYNYYKWNTGATGPAILVATDGIYQVIATDSVCTDTASVVIKLIPAPASTFPADTLVCLKDQPLVITAPPGVKYAWQSLPDTVRTVRITAAGNYSVQVMDTYGCQYTFHTNIADCSYALHTPNAFTPNGDGINEVFRVEGPEPVAFEMKIFNRFNQEIFSTKDFYQGWDGNYLGAPCPSGVYLYKCSALQGNADRISEWGGVFTLLR
jgi:gliding motility-associated-like protein